MRLPENESKIKQGKAKVIVTSTYKFSSSVKTMINF